MYLPGLPGEFPPVGPECSDPPQELAEGTVPEVLITFPVPMSKYKSTHLAMKQQPCTNAVGPKHNEH